MHAIRGSWVGQTFALARCSDSGGKNSRIKRSKEERKTMVESFIKKYQESNKGEFPSLSITKKEVGGSFYLIREIVREIIQENRVLGPAKLTTEEQNADNFFDQYPLGSVSMEPDIHVISSDEPNMVATYNLSDHHQNTIESQVLESSEECQKPENWKLDDGIIVNDSSFQSEKAQLSGGSLDYEVPVINGLNEEHIVEKELVTSEAKITQVATDLVIETFPVKLVTDTSALDGNSGDPQVIAETVSDNDNGSMDLEPDYDNDNGSMDLEQLSGGSLDYEVPVINGLKEEHIVEKELVTSEAKITQVATDLVIEIFPVKLVTDTSALDGNSGDPQVIAETVSDNDNESMDLEPVKDVVLNMEDVEKRSSKLGNEKTDVIEENYTSESRNIQVNEKVDASPENLNHSTREISNVLKVNDERPDLGNEGILPAKLNCKSAPNGVENLDATIRGCIQGLSISEEAATGKTSGIENGRSSKKLSDPTLDRINLESWEATTNRSGEPQDNSFMGFVKAVITAFVKFWS